MKVSTVKFPCMYAIKSAYCIHTFIHLYIHLCIHTCTHIGECTFISCRENSQSGAAGPGFVASFFLPSKEQKRAKAEFEKWQKEIKQKSGENVRAFMYVCTVCMLCMYVCVLYIDRLASL